MYGLLCSCCGSNNIRVVSQRGSLTFLAVDEGIQRVLLAWHSNVHTGAVASSTACKVRWAGTNVDRKKQDQMRQGGAGQKR